MVLIILFGYGLSLEGASKGIRYYVTPDFSKLGEIQVWNAAAIQILYSLGPGMGGLITLASYNKFDSNCHRDAILVAVANCCTSIFAGFAVFSILGFMATQTGKEVEDVIKGGPGLAFIAYPEAVAKMGSSPVPQIMSFLFFSMLLTLGLDSMFTMVETVTTCIFDQFKQLVPYKPFVVIATCVVGFLCGLSMCTKGGLYMFTLFADYSASWNLLILAFLEVILVSWCYGADNFLNNIKEMGMKLPWLIKMYWKMCWMFITPIILLVVVIITFVQQKKLQTVLYKKEDGEEEIYVWPDSIQVVGWLMPLSTVLIIPFFGIYQIWKRKTDGKCISGWTMFKPTNNWGPSPDSERIIESEIHERNKKFSAVSRRASRLSFRKHLPPNSENLI